MCIAEPGSFIIKGLRSVLNKIGSVVCLHTCVAVSMEIGAGGWGRGVYVTGVHPFRGYDIGRFNVPCVLACQCEIDRNRSRYLLLCFVLQSLSSLINRCDLNV